MPPRMTAQDFDQELLILVDAYAHGDLDRRGFLSQAQRFAKAPTPRRATTAQATQQAWARTVAFVKQNLA